MKRQEYSFGQTITQVRFYLGVKGLKDYKVTYMGNELRDKDKKLYEYGIPNQATIKIVKNDGIAKFILSIRSS
jgi:hypothetical protein